MRQITWQDYELSGSQARLRMFFFVLGRGTEISQGGQMFPAKD